MLLSIHCTVMLHCAIVPWCKNCWLRQRQHDAPKPYCTIVLCYCTAAQKLLAQAKTRSLQGLLLDGYEDDTVDQPEWLDMDPSGTMSYNNNHMSFGGTSAVDEAAEVPPVPPFIRETTSEY